MAVVTERFEAREQEETRKGQFTITVKFGGKQATYVVSVSQDGDSVTISDVEPHSIEVKNGTIMFQTTDGAPVVLEPKAITGICL